ncbi:DUF736 family protein [Oceanibaculum indicum]|uniref:Uncharacterized protein (DUF736 family) n=1 Tax=Oceanibaculum indicum TaxID=526216 RepID=A0A420WPY6_9PROT|nr:DUF736 family protein [Oceanibaculum indicum]RKQ73097.1 uncharacterized protein (DUF736 family) [Oceanibaculum indicum]
MASIGKLKSGTHDRGIIYWGRVATLQFGAEIALVPTGNDDDTLPSHMVVTKVHGGVAELGAAFAKKVKNGENAGKTFYSMTLDDPSFAAPMHLSAFPLPNGEEGLDVVWRRPRASLPSPDAIAQANRDHDKATGSTGAPLDDQIPF